MRIDRAVEWLLPREEHFYDLPERGAACGLVCSTLLATFRSESMNPGRQAPLKQRDEVESRADRTIAEVYEAPSRTLVTPIDRPDIDTLATYCRADSRAALMSVRLAVRRENGQRES